jgi:Holliday junction resolvase RusA-like endonuclease
MTTAPITIELAGEPKGKGRPRFDSRSRRTFTPSGTRAYEGNLAWAAQVAMKGRKPLTGPLSVAVTAFVSVPQSWSRKKQREALAGHIRPTTRPDADNYLKAAMDALNSVAFVDDSQCVDVHVTKAYSDKPRLVITIAPLTSATSEVERAAA